MVIEPCEHPGMTTEREVNGSTPVVGLDQAGDDGLIDTQQGSVVSAKIRSNVPLEQRILDGVLRLHGGWNGNIDRLTGPFGIVQL